MQPALEGKKIQALSYNCGSYFGGEYEFSIEYEEDTPYLLARGYNGIMLQYKQALTEEEMTQFAKNLVEANVASWNGFDKSDKDILDGYSFCLEIQYDEGTKLRAHGYMKYPKNYEAVHKALMDFFLGTIEANTDFDRENPGESSSAYDENAF